MNRFPAIISCIALAAGLTVIGGCNKKVTKVEPAPQQAAPADTTPRQVAPAAERESFETVDPDAAVREVLQTVYFEYDQTNLLPATADRLQLIAKMLEEKTAVSLLLEGHADERGTNEYNIGLGERRSRAVKNWLTNYGIGDRRLEVTSFGRERPAMANCGTDETCHAKNRRVEFKVLAK
jgi:peptidoglycan-associated lipoprotein